MMKLENGVLIAAWVVTFLLLFAVPRAKTRLALVAMLFHQLLTWPLGLTVVELGLVAYPVRLFPAVGQNSFTYEFFTYPIFSALFVVHYPNGRSPLVQFAYYAAACTLLTILEAALQAYTSLIRYVHWNWFCSWSSLLFTLLVTRTFCVVFFRERKPYGTNSK
jgi:hypothetical protein